MSVVDRQHAAGVPAADTRPESWGIAPELVARVDAARLLSLDIFDTLLFRATAHPHDVFTIAAQRALERGWLPGHLTAEAIRSLRVNAEQRARRRKHASAPAEVTLTEIWAEMPFAGSYRAQLVDLEVDVESEVCFRNPAIWSLAARARARGIPVALVSDMYLTRPDLGRLLTRAGCPPESFDAIFVSSEGRGAKWNGQLFDRLVEQFPHVPRSAMLHIGDNVRADVERANEAGLQSSHYPAVNARLSEIETLERLRHGSIAGHLHALRTLAASGNAESDPTTSWWFDLGALVLGPFLAAFADYVVTACASEGLATVRPLMREGALFAELLRGAAVASQLPLDIEPLFVSRAAVWLASLEAFDEQAIHDLCARPHLTTAEALAALGIGELPAGLGAYAGVALSASEPARASLRNYVSDPAIRARVESHRRSARERLTRFLLERCGDATRVALVDLGFHGTVGTAVERVMAAHTIRWTQFLALGAESLDRHWFEMRDVRAFVGGPGSLTDLAPVLVRHAAVLEAILVSGDTTIGYRDSARGVRATTVTRQCSGEQVDTIAACHRGILAFQRAWLEADASTRGAFSASVDRRHLCQMLHRLIDLPTAEESRRIGALTHEHNGGSAAVEPLVAQHAVAANLSPEELLEGASDAGIAPLWPQGLVTCRWPQYLRARWEDLRDDAGGAPALVRVARRARRQGVRECLVYGAGDAGRTVATLLREEGVAIRGFVDRNDSLWGTAIDGVTVSGPQQALLGDCHTYVVGSIAFAGAIGADLIALYGPRAGALRIVSVVDDEASRRAA